MLVSDMLRGALAGLVATLPMTLSMEAMFRFLPRREQYPLPPGEITAKVTDELGVTDHVAPRQHLALTLFNHFAYGAAAGSLYGAADGILKPKFEARAALLGMTWGTIVWTVSYLGLLPALGVLKPATQHPGRRNVLMIVAHLVWGCVLGVLSARWRQS